MSQYEANLDLLKRKKLRKCVLISEVQALKHLNNSYIYVLWGFPLYEAVSYVS